VQAEKIAPGDGLRRAARYGLRTHRRVAWRPFEEPVPIVGEAHDDPRSREGAGARG
jgi:hypothetical protein